MNRVESSFDYPLSFLKRVAEPDGEEYLRFIFENPDEDNCWFNHVTGKLDCIKILPRNDKRGTLLDEETNEREFELSFSEFVEEELEKQIEISKNLIFEQSKQNGQDKDAKLYNIVLLDCLKMQKGIDSSTDHQFTENITRSISKILTYVYNKFESRYPKTREIKSIFSYFQKRKVTNITGFKLKFQKRNASLTEFIGYLKKHRFITGNTSASSVLEFFKGKIPRNKINWNKDLHELKYFIDSICYDDILDKKPKQRWKHLHEVFTCHGEALPKDWQRNNNKLKNPHKKQAIDVLADLLRPSLK